jgi:hypothetical protein
MREYPVSNVLAVYAIEREKRREKREKNDGELVEPEFYSVVPDCGTDYDLPFSLSLSPGLYPIR